MVKKFDVGDRQIYLKRSDKFKDSIKENLEIVQDVYKGIKNNFLVFITCVSLAVEGCYVASGFFERYFEKKPNLEARIEQPKTKPIQKIKHPKSEEKFSLPEHVEKSIDHWASMYNNDKLMTESIAYWESGGDIYKVSSQGAAGVMQVMPGTARQVELDVPHYPFKNDGKYYDCKYSFTRCDTTNDQRFNLDYNIRAGMKYQEFLKKLPYIKNDKEKMLAAYHAGPGYVNKYCDGLSYDNCKKKLPTETQKYVKGVMYIYNNKKARH
ncbi:MAG: lytic transglycosylase domain-containing protein [Candidatus Nanoarchaeia archaeon]